MLIITLYLSPFFQIICDILLNTSWSLWQNVNNFKIAFKVNEKIWIFSKN